MADSARPSAAGDTAERILSAADREFAARGFSGVSMRDIAEAAGVNKALIFYHFGNKASLFERVMERYYTAHARALAYADEEPGPLRRRLHRVIDAYLDFIEENHRYPQLVQREIGASAESQEPIQRGITTLASWLTDALAEILPARGPLATRQFFIDFSAMVLNYYLYAPVLQELWDDDPMSATHRRERREHLHWMVDAVLEKLEREGAHQS